MVDESRLELIVLLAALPLVGVATICSASSLAGCLREPPNSILGQPPAAPPTPLISMRLDLFGWIFENLQKNFIDNYEAGRSLLYYQS